MRYQNNPINFAILPEFLVLCLHFDFFVLEVFQCFER
jgi:hypothetical protein